MRREVVVVENFYSHPETVVRYAQSLEYVYPYQPRTAEHQRISWRTSRYLGAKTCPFKSSQHLIARLEGLTGERIDIDSWNRDFPVDVDGYPAAGYEVQMQRSAWWHGSFHVKHEHNQDLGAGVHSHTDIDGWNSVGIDGWAGLVYLNEHPANSQGGLHTWDNRDPARQFEWMTPAENWILRDTFSNKYNRLILHRGNIPHSGADGWGDSVTNGRFFQTFFFRVVRRKSWRGVSPRDLGLER